MSSVHKLDVPAVFFTITAVHGSLKSSEKQKERESANLPITSLHPSVIYDIS